MAYRLYTKIEGIGLIVHAIIFQDFQPVCSWSTNVTDRRTDDMQSQFTSLFIRKTDSTKKKKKNKTMTI